MVKVEVVELGYRQQDPGTGLGVADGTDGAGHDLAALGRGTGGPIEDDAGGGQVDSAAAEDNSIVVGVEAALDPGS